MCIYLPRATRDGPLTTVGDFCLDGGRRKTDRKTLVNRNPALGREDSFQWRIGNETGRNNLVDNMYDGGGAKETG